MSKIIVVKIAKASMNMVRPRKLISPSLFSLISKEKAACQALMVIFNREKIFFEKIEEDA
ncbi:MAG: hypothetical protein C0168_08045 [Candidatus Aminicenantes bacterium]|nr:MAG: hypothetical protein C0168_08045 [Candidatus Aminicenantes bacterium]